MQLQVAGDIEIMYFVSSCSSTIHHPKCGGTLLACWKMYWSNPNDAYVGEQASKPEKMNVVGQFESCMVCLGLMFVIDVN